MAQATIDDTYAEAFRSIYAEVLITARDRMWLDQAVAGRHRQRLEHDPVRLRSGAGSLRRSRRRANRSPRPTAGPARSCSSTSRVFARTASKRWSGRCWCASARTCCTCPTAACFNLLDEPSLSSSWAARSRFSATAISSATSASAGKSGWCRSCPASSCIDARFGYRDGLMGGNLWFMGSDREMRLWPPPNGRSRRRRSVPGRDHCLFPAAWPRAARRPAADTSSASPAPIAELLPHAARKAGRRSRAFPRGCRRSRRSSSTAATCATIVQRNAGRHRRRGRDTRTCCRSRPATTAAGWARASSICIRKSSLQRRLKGCRGSRKSPYPTVYLEIIFAERMAWMPRACFCSLWRRFSSPGSTPSNPMSLTTTPTTTMPWNSRNTH